MRVCLFTDTLGDINGVSRFVQTLASHAARSGHDLVVLTSTRMAVPGAHNIVNLRPAIAARMPGYPDLELVWPPRARMLREVQKLRPDAIHVSTPGPVGHVGRSAARRLGVPLLGTYHTDFPAYVTLLFDDAVMGRCTAAVMRWFYKPFARILLRSDQYTAPLTSLGLDPSTFAFLRPGTDTAAFHPRFRDVEIWSTQAPGPSTCRVLYCGRLSVEKNLPFLAEAWALASPLLRSRGLAAEFFLVGDGPYRAAMQTRLRGTPVRFLGIRRGLELSALYASADLFVFPSLTDTLGQTVMEAQASGLPVIVADRGGPMTMISPGRTGLVLPTTDPGCWARAIADLVADPARRAVMGVAAHEHMQAYSFAGSFDHFWDLHEQAVARSRLG